MKPAHFGSPGEKFIYEMDHIFGPLLGITRYYSKVEGAILLLAAYGQITIFSSEAFANFLTCLFMQFGLFYFLLAAIYFRTIQEPFGIQVCTILAVLTGSCLVYRVKYFFSWSRYGHSFVNLSVIAFILCVLGGINLVQRAPKYERVIKKWKRTLQFCEEHRDFVWLPGKDQPEGMNY